MSLRMEIMIDVEAPFPHPKKSFSFSGGSKLGNEKNSSKWFGIACNKKSSCREIKWPNSRFLALGLCFVCAPFNRFFICASDCGMNYFIGDQAYDLEDCCQASCVISFSFPLISK